MKGAWLLTAYGARNTVTPPAPGAGSVDVRAVDVSYWDGVEGSGFFNDTDTSFPVSTTADRVRVVGFRFALAIPKDATVTSAVLTAYQNQNSTWVVADDRTLGAEQVDNAGVASSLADLQARYTNRGTTVTWSNAGTILNSQPVPTGSITAMLQAIVNRAGWVSGNHVMLWCSHPGSGGHNAQWRSVVGQSAGVQPRLEVGFTS